MHLKLVHFIATFPILLNIHAAQITHKNSASKKNVNNIMIECHKNEISVLIFTKSNMFNGMIYPEGLSKNSTCWVEFNHHKSPIYYNLPLHSCNTMSTVLENGNCEYFNTIIIQPHKKLVTNQGIGYKIRCQYQMQGKIITNDLNAETLGKNRIVGATVIPTCNMRILVSNDNHNEVAQNVKIGDPLTLIISIDNQNMYGLKVRNCLVRDGIGWGEQELIDSYGCPIDPEIMGMFEYTPNQTTGFVHFQAHKFPYSSSVYYQCNVKLCYKAENGCDNEIQFCKLNQMLRKRRSYAEDPATIEVFGGLYVNEGYDLIRSEKFDLGSRQFTEDIICISQHQLAIGICIMGVILLVVAVTLITVFLTRKKPHAYVLSSGSSLYSGQYTNIACSHSG